MKFEEVEVNSKRWLDSKDLLNEEWRDIKDYEGLYQISNYGRVKRKRIPQAKILKNMFTTTGYYRITLSNIRKQKDFKVHRLVAQEFLPNLENKKQVNHIDGNKLNNNVNNLEWVTNKENVRHAILTGLRAHHKIKNYDENKIIEMYNQKSTYKEIASENNVSTWTCYQVLKRNNVLNRRQYEQNYNIGSLNS